MPKGELARRSKTKNELQGILPRKLKTILILPSRGRLIPR